MRRSKKLLERRGECREAGGHISSRIQSDELHRIKGGAFVAFTDNYCSHCNTEYVTHLHTKLANDLLSYMSDASGASVFYPVNRAVVTGELEYANA